MMHSHNNALTTLRARTRGRASITRPLLSQRRKAIANQRFSPCYIKFVAMSQCCFCRN